MEWMRSGTKACMHYLFAELMKFSINMMQMPDVSATKRNSIFYLENLLTAATYHIYKASTTF